MAYIQITTRCNMACDHCCFACTKHTGEHMTIETYRNALSFAEDTGAALAIGGGEPTMHPRFWEFFGMALGSQVDSIFMATNGKLRETAKRLYRISQNTDFVCIELSQDKFHEPIDPEVVALFKKTKQIRTVPQIMPVGSALANNVYTVSEGCACDDIFIRPNGDVCVCGCLDAPVLFNVNTLPDNYSELLPEEYGYCWKNQPENEDD